MNDAVSNIMNIESPFRGLGPKTRGDKYIWGIVVMLAITSLLVVYSATGSLAYKMYKGNTEVYLFRQLSFIVLGLAVIYFLHRVNYTLYSRVSLILYLISVPLLLYTLLDSVEAHLFLSGVFGTGNRHECSGIS